MICMTFMYGLMMPILFPMCFFGLINFFMTDTLLVIYFYRKPPSYNEKMDVVAGYIVKLSPIFMFVLGYWAFGNTQKFSNKPAKLSFVNKPPNPNHNIIEFSQID